MEKNIDMENKQALREILAKGTQAQISDNFTDALMGKIQLMDAKDGLIEKYIKRSWLFIALALLLSLKAVSLLPYMGATFSVWLNSYLPGSADFLLYTQLSLLSGLFFYQLNSLLSSRMLVKLP